MSIKALRVLFMVGAITLACLALSALIFGPKAFEKIATVLVLPLGMLWYLLCVTLVVAAVLRARRTLLFVGVVWLCITLVGNVPFSERLAEMLEAPYADVQPLKQGSFSVVIVLGGGSSTAINGRHQGNRAGDRLILAGQLYHLGLTQSIICTGETIESMSTSQHDPAAQCADVLMNLGVPQARIEQHAGRNTAEEMLSLGQRFNETGLRVGLITSAWHLSRALRLAHQQGFYPHPLPADFMTRENIVATWGEAVHNVIPQADALANTTRIVKEVLGGWVGR